MTKGFMLYVEQVYYINFIGLAKGYHLTDKS